MVKISTCICGDMAVDLPSYVLLTMEGIGILHVPDVHVFAGVLSVRLRLVAAQ